MANSRIYRNEWRSARIAAPHFSPFRFMVIVLHSVFASDPEMNYPAASCEVSLWRNSSILSKQASRNSPEGIKIFSTPTRSMISNDRLCLLSTEIDAPDLGPQDVQLLKAWRRCHGHFRRKEQRKAGRLLDFFAGDTGVQ
jgi:hypothetical protein